MKETRNRAHIFTFLLVFLLFCSTAVSQQPYFQQEVNYKMDVKLNDKQHSISAVQEIQYINNSSVSLEFIWFHLWPNAYKNDQTALAKQMLSQNRKDLYYSEESERGFIDSLNFQVNGKQVKWEYDKEHIDICKLILNEPLKSLDTITITTPFFVQIPDAKFSRLGHTGQAYFMTQWYPKPAVFDNKGWHPMPYLDQGEFYSEFGSFDVKITLPQNYLLAATGDRIEAADEEDFLNKKVIETLERLDKMDYKKGDMDFPESSTTFKTIRFRQYRVHDFAWFADKRFNVIHDQIELPVTKRTVDTWVFFTNKNFELWKNAITYVNESTLFYSYCVGDYPYNNITAVDGTIMAGGGMEYPNITVIGDMNEPDDLDVTIAHEVGHNWFYGILGSNERDLPFMDEGINSFYELRYQRAKYPQKKFTEFIGQDSSFRFFGLNKTPFWKEKELLFLFSLKAHVDQPVNLSSEDYTLFNYGSIVYGKAPVVFDYLMEYMGEENFDKAMRFYYEQFRYKHPEPMDLFKTLSFFSGKDLDWFTAGLMTTTTPIDYKIKRVKQNKDGSFELKIKNKTGLTAPLNIYGYKGDKPVGLVWYDGFEKSKKLTFPPSDVDYFKIDGMDRMPDINRRNNISDAHGLFKRAKPLKLNFLTRLEDPAQTHINFIPILGGNHYNGFMLGAAVYNYGVFDKPFDYLIAPMFGFRTRTPVGFAEMNYNFYPRNLFRKITVGVKGKSFTYDLFDTKNLNDANGTDFKSLYYNYYKIAPQIHFELKKKRATSTVQQFIAYTNNNLFTDSLDESSIATLAVSGPKRKNNWSFVNSLSYELYNKRVIDPFRFKVELQHTASMAKVSGFINYRVQTGKKYFMDLRLFGGAFISGSNAERGYYSFRAGGYRGSDDYLFDYNYVGRNVSDGFGYSQFTETDGAMKVPVLFGYGRYWMAGLNVKSPKLFILPVKIFADVVATDGRDLLKEKFLWDAGLNVTVLDGILDVYFPMLYSDDIRRTLDLNNVSRGNRIRFTLNIHKLVPKDFMKTVFFK